ncbi:hypothetical protein QE152_g27727 [Popillia japonica]|uniref:Uncharacterized protein n=1 Tax=Popillia japonica TaxID=7064 RepID=A0AAW1JSH7_POPJA
MLIERQDIILWRRRYLNSIRKFRSEGRKIYYLYETWINAGHTKQNELSASESESVVDDSEDDPDFCPESTDSSEDDEVSDQESTASYEISQQPEIVLEIVTLTNISTRILTKLRLLSYHLTGFQTQERQKNNY